MTTPVQAPAAEHARSSSSQPYKAVAIALSLAAVSFVLWQAIVNFGMVQFIGLDGGLTLNTGWQMKLGYKPYSELVSGFPPLYLMGIGCGFALWGATWVAAVKVTALFAVIAFLAHFFLIVRLKVPWYLALAIAGSAQWIALVTISFWWYNQPSSIAAALFITAAMGFAIDSKSAASSIAVALTGALLMLAKLNDAVAALGTVSLVMVALGPRRGRFIGAMAAAVLVAAAVMLLCRADLREFVHCCYATSVARAHDGSSTVYRLQTDWDSTGVAIASGACVAILLVAGAVVLLPPSRAKRVDATLVLLALCGLATTLICIITNRDLKASDMTPSFAAVSLLVALGSTRLWAMRKAAMALTACMAVCLALAVYETGRLGFERYRILAGHGYYNDEESTLKEIEDPGVFQGLESGPRLPATMFDLTRLVDRFRRQDPHVTINLGPRLDFGYPMLNLPPPKRVPIFWEGFRASEFQTEILKHPSDVFIFNIFQWDEHRAWGDAPFFPEAASEMIDSSYLRVSTPRFIVFMREDKFSALAADLKAQPGSE